MLTELTGVSRVVGVKQSRKAVLEGRAARIYLAFDADPAVTEPLEAACRERGVPVEKDASMAQLGRACQITVGAAVAAVLK